MLMEAVELIGGVGLGLVLLAAAAGICAYIEEVRHVHGARIVPLRARARRLRR